MSDDDYLDDEIMGLKDDFNGGELVDEFDRDVFNNGKEEDLNDDDLDDADQGDNDSDDDNTDEEVEQDKEIGRSDLNKPEVGYCQICGAEVNVDELPDSISRDAFDQFGLCLNCQWGIFTENGGHF